MQALAAVVLTLIALAVATWLMRRPSKRYTPVPGTRPIPQPTPHAFLGNIPLVAANAKTGRHIDILLQELTKEYGPVFVIDVLFFKLLIVSDPDVIKEVIVRNFPKAVTYTRLYPLIGGEKSILVLDGEAWKHQRMAFNPGFSFQHLRTLIPLFVSNTRRAVDKLSAAAGTGEVVPLHRLLTILTLNIICEVVLAQDFDLLSDERAPELHTRLNKVLDITQWYNQNSGFGWTRHLPWNKRITDYHVARYDELLLKVIRQRMAEAQGAPSPAAGADGARVGSKGSSKGEDSILSAAIKAAKDEGSALDEEHILAQVKSFVFAGHDTTASTVAWAVYEVSRHPEVERRVVQEIREVCRDSDPSADDLSKLQYLDCVVKETLRMWPPAASARAGPPGAVIDNYDVTGMQFYICQFVLHRDPKLWGEDAEVFRPERWLDEDYVSKLHPYAYQPFSKGPRDCIGQTFAKLEAKTLLAMLFSKYEFKYAGPEPEHQTYSITSRPRFGCPFKVAVRKG